MSELTDRVNAKNREKAEWARKRYEESLGPLLREPTKEEAPLILEFLQNYRGSWVSQTVWAPDGVDHVCQYPGDRKHRRKNSIHEVECVWVRHYDEGYGPIQLYVFRDGHVSGATSHELLVDELAEMLAV